MLGTWRRGAGDDVPIFKSRSGGALSTVQVWRIVSQAATRAGFKASPHWMRHAHATHAIDHGCDIRTLQMSLGHASSETTERYVHSRPTQSSGAFVRRAELDVNRAGASEG
jgi:integrase/recombinase XerD